MVSGGYARVRFVDVADVGVAFSSSANGVDARYRLRMRLFQSGGHLPRKSSLVEGWI